MVRSIYLIVLVLAALLAPAPVWASFDCAAVTQIPQHECEALVAFYETTNQAWMCHNRLESVPCEEWYSGWTSNLLPCTWQGITCAGGHVTVVEPWPVTTATIDMGTPHIPPEFGDLSHLEVLRLWSLRLTGTIPSELGRLGALRELVIVGADLTGTLPAEVGRLPSLQVLEIGATGLSGALPLGITGSELEVLRLATDGLCVPNLPVFAAWLQRIPEVRVSPPLGSPCEDGLARTLMPRLLRAGNE